MSNILADLTRMEIEQQKILLDKFDTPLLPHLRRALDNYVLYGHMPGDFLQCCIANEFCQAVKRADPTSTMSLWLIADYIWNAFPAGCWGHRALMEKWCSDKQLRTARVCGKTMAELGQEGSNGTGD